jgi:hypothetical protein
LLLAQVLLVQFLDGVWLVGRLTQGSLHFDNDPQPVHGRAGRSGIPSLAFHAVA